MRHQVFLSYAERDEAIAIRFKDRLETAFRAGICFLAKVSIQPGTAWFESIIAALDEAQVFVLLLTPASIASSWGSFELGYACAKGTSLVVLGLGVAGSDLTRVPHGQFQLTSVEDLTRALEAVAKKLELEIRQAGSESARSQEELGEHLRVSREECDGLSAARAAGVVAVHAAWRSYAPAEFVTRQERLWIFLKDGYSFFRSEERQASSSPGSAIRG